MATNDHVEETAIGAGCHGQPMLQHAHPLVPLNSEKDQRTDYRIAQELLGPSLVVI